MTISELEASLPAEDVTLLSRARAYLRVRLALQVVLMLVVLAEAQGTDDIMALWVVGADVVGLLLYRLAATRWPKVATYISLMVTALLLIAFDLVLGRITFYPWLLLIPLSLAGGLIVGRPGFNSLVTLTLLTMFGSYLGLLYLGWLTLPIGLPTNLLYGLAIALAVLIVVLNAMAETLVVHVFETQEDLVRTQVQLLQTLNELELSRHELYSLQVQARRHERLTAISQVARQLRKTLGHPLGRLRDLITIPPDTTMDPPHLAEAQRQVDSALRVMEALDHISELGAINPKTVNLDDLLALELSQMQIPPVIAIELKLPPIFPPIQADAEHMRLLLHHLLSNALNAMPSGGRLTIELAPNPEGIRFTVSDTGRGIAPAHLPHIFEPLYTTEEGRFGLGLAICQQVVELHGGRIEVQSTVGAGSVFHVYLPRMPRQPLVELVQDLAG